MGHGDGYGAVELDDRGGDNLGEANRQDNGIYLPVASNPGTSEVERGRITLRTILLHEGSYGSSPFPKWNRYGCGLQPIRNKKVRQHAAPF